PPLLFIPFIENAFKHSLSFRNHSFIHIALKLTSGKILFTCLNSVGESSQPGDGQHSGIGLENVRKRLNLLFPHRHHLQISEKEGEFNIFLDITLET
ncbi:MAG TPA: GHKL domain-containing protein, partial [Prolixibacteraceae bacterium]|nr:GHKL domain-containing protein [Prolixibacteraceae bacterium]